MAPLGFYHKIDDEGNRLTMRERHVGPRRLNRCTLARAPGDLAAGRDRRRHRSAGSRRPSYPISLTTPRPGSADMDTMGVDQAVVFPTLFNEYLPLVDNPQAARALAQGYETTGSGTFAAPTNDGTGPPGRDPPAPARSLLPRDARDDQDNAKDTQVGGDPTRPCTRRRSSRTTPAPAPSGARWRNRTVGAQSR